MLVQARHSAPPPQQPDFDLRIHGPDQGLISAWLAGIAFASAKPEPPEVAAALRDELPILPFKGGIDKVIKTRSKIGALQYLAMWQGLRGNDLCLDTNDEPLRTCSKTGVTVLYTLNTQRLLANGADV